MAAVTRRRSERAGAARRRGTLTRYFSRHLQTAVAALGRLREQPFASFLTMLVIAVTLALPASLHLVIKNALAVTGGWQSAVDFSVYLHTNVDLEQARKLAALIGSRADVAGVDTIPADRALAEFKESSGFGEALDGLEENPLPHTLVVRPAREADEATIALLREELDNLPETDLVQLDTRWVERFHAMLELVRRGLALAAALLAAAVVIVIGNTIRLDIQNRRDEIEITKLIGASDGFIRRPFLYAGLWYGLAGGLLALAVLGGGLWLLEGPVDELAGLYASTYELLGLDWREALAVVGAGGALGLAGSWLAAARHMRRIEPS